jgi:hypothetical protein
MGIGTKEFEQRFATALAALRSSGQVAGVCGRSYVNDLLGIAFALPAGWLLRDLQEVSETAEGRLLSSHEHDWNEAFRSLSDAFLPLVTISAPTWDDPLARLGPHELSPVAVLQFEHAITDEEVATFDLWDHVATDLSYFHAHVEDFRLLVPPSQVTLSECDAVTYSAAYTLLHADAVEGCPTREQAVYVRQDSAIYALRLCDYPDRHPQLSFDFASFLTSVCFR